MVPPEHPERSERRVDVVLTAFAWPFGPRMAIADIRRLAICSRAASRSLPP